MVQSIVNNKLKEPSLVIGSNDNALFSGLMAHGVRLAIGMLQTLLRSNLICAEYALDVYIDRRENWVKEEVEGTAKQMDADIIRYGSFLQFNAYTNA
jgi:hypothetical protein